MAKINRSSGGGIRPPVSQNSKSTAEGGKVFKGLLGRLTADSSTAESNEISHIDTEAELQSVVDSIHQLGEKLLAYPVPDTLAAYKQAVRNFITHVTHTAYATKEYLSRKNILNQKKYVLIQVVDEKLEKLSRNVLTSQKQQIDMLCCIEEIQGLLINLLHVS